METLACLNRLVVLRYVDVFHSSFDDFLYVGVLFAVHSFNKKISGSAEASLSEDFGKIA